MRKYKWWFLTGALLLGWMAFLVGVSWWQREKIVFPVEREVLAQGEGTSQYSYQIEGDKRRSLGMVYGFLPYWNVDNYKIADVVTHVSYFRLAVDGKGRIVDDAGSRIYNDSERMAEIFKQIDRGRIGQEVTFFTSHSDEIYQLVTCQRCRETFLDNIIEVVKRDQLAGVNLDLEYVGTLTAKERAEWTSFLYQLKNKLNQEAPRTKLSIDVYGGAARMPDNLWDFAKLSTIVDRVMLMGYDYKTRSADVPGSSAPLLSNSIWGGSIWEDVKSLTRFVPAEKIILVVPFYGYAWETTTCDLATAKTYPGTGETLTYRGAQNLLADKSSGAKEYWDSEALSPYLVYRGKAEDGTDDNRCKIGFFENARSLGHKMELIDQLHLGGIAVWAMGYEGDYAQLWEAIGERF